MFKKEVILNLCDRSIDEMARILNGMKAARNTIIQVGSYSCSNYFKYLLSNLNLMKQKFENPTYDLVIPILPEHEIEVFKSDNYLNACYDSRKIVVNDYGTMILISNKDYSIRMGRLFFKDYRDSRYEEYHNSVYEGKVCSVINFSIECGFKIDSIETDIITSQYVLPDINKDIMVYFHFPYRQISVSHICEFASVNKSVGEKFIPDDECEMQCMNQFIKYHNVGYFKIGKNIYDLISEEFISANIKDKNVIVTPDW